MKDLNGHVGKEIAVAGWVDVRRDQWAAAAPMDQDLRWTIRWSHRGKKTRDRFDGSCSLARERRAKPVETKILGAPDDWRWD